MIKRISTPIFVFVLSVSSLFSQTVDELKSIRAAKQAEVAAMQGEVNTLTKKIEAFPGWKIGAFGTVGVNFSQFNDWLGSATPNTFSGVIGLTANAFANLDQEKYFWRNNGNFNYTRTRLAVDKSQVKDAKFQTTMDVINAVSLYGYKLNPKIAISGLGEYRSTIGNFNDPGYLDLGAGATWTPMSNLVVVFHPLNYNFVFSSSDGLVYESSLGTKIVADYSRKLPMGLSWRSNLSAFASYSSLEDLSNWTWINGFSFTAWKGIGVGFEVGLRNNKQEGYNAKLASDAALTPDNFKIGDLNTSDNPLQSYWLLGITYSL